MPSWCETIFSLFVFSTTIIFYSTYSAMSMAHAHVLCESWKTLRTSKVRLCMIWIFYVMKMEYSQNIWFCRDKLSLVMLFWEDIIALLVCLKYYCFYVNIKLLFWIIWIWTFMPQERSITWINMLGSIPHQKFCFYHLPTRGRAWIKLGDTWYVSNVSIIFLLFHAIILSVLDVLYAFICYFIWFLGLTY